MTDKTASEPTSAAYRQCQRCMKPIAGSFVVRGLLCYHVECSISDADRLTVANAEIARLAARVQEQAAEIERLTKERDDARRALVISRSIALYVEDAHPYSLEELGFLDQQVAAARAAVEGEKG